jgi:hypothetical protein
MRQTDRQRKEKERAREKRARKRARARVRGRLQFLQRLLGQGFRQLYVAAALHGLAITQTRHGLKCTRLRCRQQQQQQQQRKDHRGEKKQGKKKKKEKTRSPLHSHKTVYNKIAPREKNIFIFLSLFIFIFIFLVSCVFLQK